MQRKGSAKLNEKLDYDSYNSTLQVPKLPSFGDEIKPPNYKHACSYIYNLELKRNSGKIVVRFLVCPTRVHLSHNISELVSEF